MITHEDIKINKWLASPALSMPCLAYLVVSVGRWGVTDDLATSSLHSSRLSAFLMAAPSVKPVHSGMLSSHLFFCLPRLLPSWTVPCMIVLASPDDLVMCPYHLSLRCLTVVRRFSWGPMACRVLFRTSSLEWCGFCMWCRGVFWGISSPWPISFSRCLLLVSKTHRRTGIWTWLGSASVWSLSWALYSSHSRWSKSLTF